MKVITMLIMVLGLSAQAFAESDMTMEEYLGDNNACPEAVTAKEVTSCMWSTAVGAGKAGVGTAVGAAMGAMNVATSTVIWIGNKAYQYVIQPVYKMVKGVMTMVYSHVITPIVNGVVQVGKAAVTVVMDAAGTVMESSTGDTSWYDEMADNA